MVLSYEARKFNLYKLILLWGMITIFGELNFDYQAFIKHLLCTKITMLASGDRMKQTFYKPIHVPLYRDLGPLYLTWPKEF